MNGTSPLIHPREVQSLIGKDSVVVVDARSGPDAYSRYQAGHVEGALHVDLDRDLSVKPADAANGGRHPLPDVKKFSELLGSLGIRPNTKVIVYDDKGGANAAARFWWMLRSVGHMEVFVVDGGLAGLAKENLVNSAVLATPSVAIAYPASHWLLPVADIDQVSAKVNEPGYTVIDVREAYRYRGESEPIDLVAGHIPGAINIPYTSNLGSDGFFKSSSELNQFYNGLLGEHNHAHVIVHCGSGVTACHTLLAMEHAGLKGAQLYVGSWSEWSRRDEFPRATGDK